MSVEVNIYSYAPIVGFGDIGLTLFSISTFISSNGSAALTMSVGHLKDKVESFKNEFSIDTDRLSIPFAVCNNANVALSAPHLANLLPLTV